MAPLPKKKPKDTDKKKEKKKKKKPGRKTGTDKKVVTARRIAASMEKIKELAAGDAEDAYKCIADQMRDEKSTPVVKKTCAEIILKINKDNYIALKIPETEIDDEDLDVEDEDLPEPFILLEYVPDEADPEVE